MRNYPTFFLICSMFFIAPCLLADPPEGLEASFRLGSSVVTPGEEFAIPVLVSSNEPLGGLSISVDFDEEVLEATRVELVYQRPDGKGWYSRWVFVDVHVDGRSNIDNSNEIPGNGGVDEGYLYAAVIFEPEERLGPYLANGGVLEDLLPPVDRENEILAIHFRVRPSAAPGETQIRFLDGAPSVNPEVTVENVAALLPGYSAELRTEIGVVGVSGLIGIVRGEPFFIRGDSNGDANLDVSDALTTLDYLFRGGVSILCLDAADANDDGELNIVDPIAVLYSLFVTGEALPPPTDGPGEDLTADSLDCLAGII